MLPPAVEHDGAPGLGVPFVDLVAQPGQDLAERIAAHDLAEDGLVAGQLGLRLAPSVLVAAPLGDVLAEPDDPLQRTVGTERGLGAGVEHPDLPVGSDDPALVLERLTGFEALDDRRLGLDAVVGVPDR